MFSILVPFAFIYALRLVIGSHQIQAGLPYNQLRPQLPENHSIHNEFRKVVTEDARARNMCMICECMCVWPIRLLVQNYITETRSEKNRRKHKTKTHHIAVPPAACLFRYVPWIIYIRGKHQMIVYVEDFSFLVCDCVVRESNWETNEVLKPLIGMPNFSPSLHLLIGAPIYYEYETHNERWFLIATLRQLLQLHFLLVSVISLFPRTYFLFVPFLCITCFHQNEMNQPKIQLHLFIFIEYKLHAIEKESMKMD